MSMPDFEVPDFFDFEGLDCPVDEAIYRARPLGRWMQAQIELGQMVIPKISRAVPIQESEHMVMWAERRSLEGGTCTLCHQILCDCAMELPIEDLEQGKFSCQAVSEFIKWGAGEVRRAKQLDVVLGFYGNIKSGIPVQEDRTQRPGDDILQTLVKDILVETQNHPGEWVGNMISGSHNIQGLSTVFDQPPEITLRVVEAMAQDKIIEILDGDVVKLRAA